MSDLNEQLRKLKQLATEACDDSPAAWPFAEACFQKAATPDAILSLIEEVEAARRAPAAAPAPVAAIKTWRERINVAEYRFADARQKAGMHKDARDAEVADLRAALAAVPAAAPIVQPVGNAVAAMKRAKALPVWGSIPHALHVELDTIFAALAAPSVRAEPVLWIDASARPHQDHGPLLPDSNRQIALLGCTEGPFGSYTTPLYAGATPTASTADAKDAALLKELRAARRALRQIKRATNQFDEAREIAVKAEKRIDAAIATSADEVKS